MRLLKLVPDNTNIDFMRWRNVALIWSILITLAAGALVFTRGLNFGVDFVGGQSVRVAFVQPPPIERLRAEIDALDIGNAEIQASRQNAVQQAAAGNAGQANLMEYTVSMPLPPSGDAASAAARVRSMIETNYRGNAVIRSIDSVSGKVSEELLSSGAWAIALAMLGIAIYIWIRFEWQFGVGALLTLFHDVWMTLGFFSLTQLDFDLNVVAAILTIVGYSLNDTVVIYDRIRENQAKLRGKSLAELVNLSINQVLGRTFLTSFATALSLIGLLIFGVGTIFDFAMAMMFGLVSGTYSTWFIAAPMTIWFEERAAKKKAKAAATPAAPAPARTAK